MYRAAPFPVAASEGAAYGAAVNLTEGALAKAPESAAITPNDLEIGQVREAVVAALASAGHSTAAQLLGSGTWTLDGSAVRVDVPGMGKKMLSLTVNAATEKIIRTELLKMGAPARFLVSAGEGVGSGCRCDAGCRLRKRAGGGPRASISQAGAGDLQRRGPQRGRFAPEVTAQLSS